MARDLFGVHMSETLDLAFDVACHVGTLVALVACFWSEILGMLAALPRALSRDPGPGGRRMRLIVVGTLPIVVVGVLGATALEDTLRTPAVAAATLAAGAVLLFVVERIGPQRRLEADLTPRDAALIGLAQATALVPGVSRSGVTIGMGLLLGYRRQEIARFTFLLSIPAILAAAAKKGLELRHTALSADDVQAFAIGMVTSAVVGYVAVRFFIRYVGGHRLDVFAWYRLALAAVLVAVLIAR